MLGNMLLNFLIVGLICASSSNAQENVTYLPTVLWHGMGDSCCNPFSMGRIMKLIEDELPGIYVYSVQIGSNIVVDTEQGFFGNVNDQVQEACNEIAADPLLQGGYNAVGFSQGSQFLRAVAQRCPFPPMNNLVTLGGQHQGVFGVPGCMDSVNGTCEEIRQQLSTEAYTPSIQSRQVQAQYWHDPLQEELYRNESIFIAEINNEVILNSEYKANLLSLENLVLGKFNQDSMVIPIESSWFGFYASGQDVDVLPLTETLMYTEDRIGLKALDDAGKLQYLATDGDHLEFSDEWFTTEIIHKYLNTEV